jgi:DNA invertase Pin-like site-specific DNA recombinase
MELLNAAIYARVSLTKGRQHTDNQLIQLRRYCKQKGWRIAPEHVYIEEKSGKASDNRKQFQAMMQAASQRQFDVLVVWALDRLSREGVMQTFEHIKRLKGYGAEFESFTEAHFRTTGPAGELMIAVAAWIAQQERVRLSQRTLAGLERARAKGKQLGRPCKILPRDKIRDLHNQGLGCRAIAKRLGGVSFMTVHRILKTTA